MSYNMISTTTSQQPHQNGHLNPQTTETHVGNYYSHLGKAKILLTLYTNSCTDYTYIKAPKQISGRIQKVPVNALATNNMDNTLSSTTNQIHIINIYLFVTECSINNYKYCNSRALIMTKQSYIPLECSF